MDRRLITLNSTKNKTKVAVGILSRQLNSPFRSSKVKRSLNSTGHAQLLHKFSKITPIRSRISPHRAYLSEIKPLRALVSTEASTSDSLHSRYTSNLPEESLNFIMTPSTIKEEEPLFNDLEESLNMYFNFDINAYELTKTPMPSNVTPDVRRINRYKNSDTGKLVPFRSETPEIPTKNRKKEEIRLPAVENKMKIRKNRSPSPQELVRAKGKVDLIQKVRNIQNFRRG